MILPKQPEDAPLGFKVRRKNGNWSVSKKNGHSFDGRFQTITELPRGMSKGSGGMSESPPKFTSLFD